MSLIWSRINEDTPHECLVTDGRSYVYEANFEGGKGWGYDTDTGTFIVLEPQPTHWLWPMDLLSLGKEE